MEILKVHEKCVDLGDFPGYMGKGNDGYKSVHEEFGYGSKNADGKRVLKFAGKFLKSMVQQLQTRCSNHCEACTQMHAESVQSRTIKF